jgi:hypothetical protein
MAVGLGSRSVPTEEDVEAVVMADSIGDGWQERWSVMADKAVGGRAESESYEHAQGGKMGVGELLLSTHVRDKAGSPTWGFDDRR